jgi:membrane peptidoglycan carboxypeptidase
MSGRTTNVGGVISLLGAFLAAAVITGFLSAGLLMPAVGAVGGSVRTVVDLFDALPDSFTTSPLSEQSVILAADGTKIATPYDENRVIVPLAEIAPIMRTAQVAIEDHRFYEHGGADLQGILRAFISNRASGEVTGGGSTLTQQYVKITLQENALRAGDKAGAKAATAQNYARKIQELKYSIQLEKTLTKDQILEGYLNLVYYGDRAYGVEAASQHYFGHSAKTMNLQEAALLAGLTQNPGTTDPVNFPDKALARRNVVLDRMKELGIIKDAEWSAARAVPLAAMLKVTPAKNSCQSSDYPYFCDYVLAWLKQDPSLDPVLGRGEAQRVQAIYRGGLTIQTTMDPKVMGIAREEVTKRVPVGNDAEIGSAAAVLDAKTGAVRAIAQNTNYNVKKVNPGDDTVNWAVDTQYGASMGFSFGSTAKAFALVTALEAGWPVSSSVFAKASGPSNPAEYTNKEFTGECGLSKPWTVRNDYNSPDEEITLVEATAQSINTAFVGLALQLGGDACKIRDTEWRMGLHQASGKKIPPYPAAIILGATSVSPMTVASAYQTLANEGVYCPPVPVLSIVKDGKALALPALGSACERRVDAEVARGVTRLLQGPLRSGGTASGSGLAGGRPAAGKTGTADGSNETWFVGYTPELSTAVWVGTPNDLRNERVVRNICLRPAGETKGCSAGRYGSVFGATIAAPIWKAIMDRTLEGTPKTPFADPGSAITDGEKVDIPDISRRSLDDAKALLLQAGFVPSVVKVYSNYRVGTVVGTSPRSQATRGSVVKVLVSQGPAPAPTAPPTLPPAVPPAG